MSRINNPSQDRSVLDVALLVVRIIVGVILMAHGAQKLFGIADGPGLEGVMGPQGPGGGGVIGLLVASGEFFGGLGILVGFLSRFSAAADIVIMLGAIMLVHGKNGFFLSDRGFEYNLAIIGLLVPVLLLGPGRFAISHLLPLPKAAGTRRTVAALE